MGYSVYTEFATQDEAIPESCRYRVHKQPAGSGRIGFRVDYNGCGTGSMMTNGLYPRILDPEPRTPSLEVAYQHLLWKSRLSGPFVSIWRSWARALRWARYLQKKNCRGIIIYAIDLDVVQNPIYDAHKIVKELQQQQEQQEYPSRGRDLSLKNHLEELLVYNGIDASTCAILASIPAGSENVKVAAHFAHALIPKELYKEISILHYRQQQQLQLLQLQQQSTFFPYAFQQYPTTTTTAKPYNNNPSCNFFSTSLPPPLSSSYYHSAVPSGTAGTTCTLFDSLLSRLYVDILLRRGNVETSKLLELVIAMCTDFALMGKKEMVVVESDVMGARLRGDSDLSTFSSSSCGTMGSVE